MANKISARNINFYYGSHQALFDNNLDIAEHAITAVIGPSGCGKSTHLRIYNRIYELYRDQRVTGSLFIDGVDVLNEKVDVLELRRKVGMIFQKPTPFPMSVFDNVAYPLRLHYRLSRSEIADKVEEALRGASLWEEVKDKLKSSGLALSGGQQQRVAIARALAMDPVCMLFDEPTSALDPEMINEVLDVMVELAQDGMTMIVVTHEMGFARRVADRVLFMENGEILENAPTQEFFTRPQSERAVQFLSKILNH